MRYLYPSLKQLQQQHNYGFWGMVIVWTVLWWLQKGTIITDDMMPLARQLQAGVAVTGTLLGWGIFGWFKRKLEHVRSLDTIPEKLEAYKKISYIKWAGLLFVLAFCAVTYWMLPQTVVLLVAIIFLVLYAAQRPIPSIVALHIDEQIDRLFLSK